jgi:hypothetical protein
VKGEPMRFVGGHNRRIRERYRVEDRGYKTPCWIWLLSKDENGYGRMHVEGKSPQAHRGYYEDARGPIPDGKQLDHLCRNRDCVNPGHLEPVTNTENSHRGANPKLSMVKAREVRRLASQGATQRAIARQFGVSQTTIWLTVNDQRWRA